MDQFVLDKEIFCHEFNSWLFRFKPVLYFVIFAQLMAHVSMDSHTAAIYTPINQLGMC